MCGLSDDRQTTIARPSKDFKKAVTNPGSNRNLRARLFEQDSSSKTPGGRNGSMKTRAAVAFEAKKPLEVVELDLEGPKAGEVLIEIKATGICHTDAYTLSGLDSEGLFPSILGHEGAGVVIEVGAGVTSVKPGDHVIPLYTPEWRPCKSCLARQTTLAPAIRATQGKGLMPDGTSRFSYRGQTIFHYMGCSTFANH